MAARKRKTKLAPIRPGEVLLADFLEPLHLTQDRLAKDISVTPRRITEIVHGASRRKREFSIVRADELGRLEIGVFQLACSRSRRDHGGHC
jgi:plasmid maintenance system antidote protein VapI